MSEKSFIDFILNKLNDNESIELSLNAICKDIFEGKSISSQEISTKFMSFRSLYKIDYIIALSPNEPPIVRFWKIEDPKQISETVKGEEECHT